MVRIPVIVLNCSLKRSFTTYCILFTHTRARVRTLPSVGKTWALQSSDESVSRQTILCFWWVLKLLEYGPKYITIVFDACLCFFSFSLEWVNIREMNKRGQAGQPGAGFFILLWIPH